ncbi:MAG: hypothetical protein HY923_02335 [Elusimicrobia bacterium]|nr:hypothetical protein [Elusimicrobiota bacterium]
MCGAFLAAFYPLHNPDLFWHLAVGRRMAELGRPLFEEPLALAGALGRGLPWIGFEWLSELFYYAAWTAGGFVGLVILKAALAAATAWALDSGMRRAAVSPFLRVSALLAWAALCQTRFMLEPELFTFLMLALLWRRIEEGRRWSVRDIASWAGLFALWANLHGGVVYGLGLLALRALDDPSPLRERAGRVLACAAAAALTPYGPAVYGVAFHLLGDMASLRAGNVEWMSPVLLPGVLPKAYFLLPLGGLALLWRRQARGEKVEIGRLLTLAAFGLWGGLSMRSISVAATVLVPLCAGLLDAEPAAKRLRGSGPALAALLVCAIGFSGAVFSARPLGSPWFGVSWAFFPRELSEALAREVPAGAIYAPFDWASYPAWRFYPERRVHAYGRLDVFHARLTRAAAARAEPSSWSAFLESEGVEAALEKPPSRRLPGVVHDPARRRVLRVARSPFAAYYPPERWVLAHWNEEGFLFARRRAGTRAGWLDPSDLDYLRLLVDQRWLDARRLCREGREHRERFGLSRYDAELESFCRVEAKFQLSK